MMHIKNSGQDTINGIVNIRGHPRSWDMRFIPNFMLAIGPVSSLFDFLTFYIMLALFHAGEMLFHTGWFIESIASPVLVIFIVCTRSRFRLCRWTDQVSSIKPIRKGRTRLLSEQVTRAKKTSIADKFIDLCFQRGE